jgi:probable F420-dependent oxidoreductase
VKFGICLASLGTYSDPRRAVEIARAAESTSWDGLFYWDHLAFVWGPPAGDPWITLAAVAASTERIRIGTAVTPLPRRRPHVLAAQIAALDVLSGGRVIFGAGLGGVPREFEAFGEPGGERIRAEMLDEGLDVVRALLSGERVEHHGEHYTVDGVTLAPTPVQSPLPIWIGARSPRAQRRAARFDGWLADSSDEHGMVMSPDDIRRGVERIGRGDGFDVGVMGYSSGPGDELPLAYRDAGATWWLESVHDIRGTLDEMLARIAAGPPA